MTTTIGRCSFDNAPSFQSWDGDALSLGINILPASLELAKVMRQQMLGLMNNPDESAIPVTCTTDSDLDGFYAVSAVQVEPVEAYITNKLMRCSVGLVRVANGYQNPTIETTVVSQLATNSHGVLSTTDYAIAVAYRQPDEDDLVDPTAMASLFLGTIDIVETIDGDASVLPLAATNVSGTWSRFGDPSLYYSAPACKIEYKVGSTWYEAVGRHVPNGVPWRISNGTVRIGPTSFPSTTVDIEVADSAAWVGTTLDLTGTDGFGGVAGPFILRNSPDTVVVKVMSAYGKFITFTVWRGGTIAMMAFTSSTATVFEIFSSPAVAATAITGGQRFTSADASGNILVLLGRGAVTVGATNLSIVNTGNATSFVFGAGWVRDTATASIETYAGMLGQLCTPPQWRSRIAAR